MDVDALRFLLQPAGRRLLAAATAGYDETSALGLNQQLRRLGNGFTAEQVAAALTQVGLRRAGAAKFGADAAAMWLTAAGLEQATAPAVATRRAVRAHASGAVSCLDLCCGIGSDLIALARTGLDVTGVERDELTAEVATANLTALGIPGRVLCAAAETFDTAPYDLVFVDPSRRKGTARIFDPAAFSPSWDFVTALLQQATDPVAGTRVAVKLSPGLDHALIPTHVEAEWVSLDGDLRETCLWSPAPSGVRRRATVLAADGSRAERTDLDPAPDPAPVRSVGEFLYEPDVAVIRAHLVTAVAAEVSGWLLDPHIAYVASDRRVSTPVATAYRVLEVLPYQEKRLRSALRARSVGTLTIKKRGVAVTPEELRRRLSLRGDEAATVILTRTPRSAVALLVERI